MKAPTIQQLLATVEAYNRAHELHLKYPPEIRANKNPLLENLYAAAVLAAEQLKAALATQLEVSPPK